MSARKTPARRARPRRPLVPLDGGGGGSSSVCVRGRQCELVARLCGCRYDKHILYFPSPSCVTFQILHQCRMRNVRLVDTATLRQNGSWTQQDRSSTPFLCVVHSHGSANGAFLTRPPPRAGTRRVREKLSSLSLADSNGMPESFVLGFNLRDGNRKR